MSTQLDRMEKSIGGMTGELRTLTKTLITNVAKCEACRQVVMGNGQKSIDGRVTHLETTQGMTMKAAVFVGAVSSAIGAIVAVVAITCS